jgi:hypothetical protein
MCVEDEYMRVWPYFKFVQEVAEVTMGSVGRDRRRSVEGQATREGLWPFPSFDAIYSQKIPS